ncbi:phosphopantothenoylcysteine decarboxylase subunit VHS3-like [Cynara cardunculus var. scolymus]|uniref:phosphopantothenoylcysteine decarboxylase subunit VHS3-like n=1 Tax=Cynara cardunculus var. scolymus TaxID=59895 RepID=UPI000D625E25|nr:phosphopantothenoylcysteine decarboxylase subunit VHS3-like [Cynara cardunculus var. scolymus]
MIKKLKVVDDAITTHEAEAEAEAEVVDDIVRADAEAHDEDLPITPAADDGDEKGEGKYDEDKDDDDSPSLPNAGKDLGGGDDDDDDDDDFTIQYHKPASTLKIIVSFLENVDTLRESEGFEPDKASFLAATRLSTSSAT